MGRAQRVFEGLNYPLFLFVLPVISSSQLFSILLASIFLVSVFFVPFLFHFFSHRIVTNVSNVILISSTDTPFRLSHLHIRNGSV